MFPAGPPAWRRDRANISGAFRRVPDKCAMQKSGAQPRGPRLPRAEGILMRAPIRLATFVMTTQKMRSKYYHMCNVCVAAVSFTCKSKDMALVPRMPHENCHSARMPRAAGAYHPRAGRD